MNITPKHCAFTLAEVLITLGIIGVVAAITLPTLINQYEKKMTVVKLKKAYNTLANVAQRGYLDNGNVTNTGSVTADNVKEFFDKYWLPYLNNPKVSPDGKFPYGKGYAYAHRYGSHYDEYIWTYYPLGRIFFTTSEGISYYVVCMYWDTDTNGNQVAKFRTHQWVAVDLNGIKPPNTLGKDVFLFTISFTENVVRPNGYNASKSAINANCQTSGASCAAKIINDGWKIKDDYLW